MGFDVVLLEGSFAPTADLSVDGSRVSDALARFVGTRVRLAAHHLPSDPVDPTRWGGGSCGYQPGPCPYGHHGDPTRMYSYTGEGVLGVDGDGWALTRFDGRVDRVGLSALVGHRGRVAVASVVDIDAMRDTVSVSGVEADLGVKVDELRSLLDRLRRT